MKRYSVPQDTVLPGPGQHGQVVSFCIHGLATWAFHFKVCIDSTCTCNTLDTPKATTEPCMRAEGTHNCSYYQAQQDASHSCEHRPSNPRARRSVRSQVQMVVESDLLAVIGKNVAWSESCYTQLSCVGTSEATEQRVGREPMPSGTAHLKLAPGRMNWNGRSFTRAQGTASARQLHHEGFADCFDAILKAVTGLATLHPSGSPGRSQTPRIIKLLDSVASCARGPEVAARCLDERL